MSTAYETYEGEVGQDNLKLVFNEGRLSRYSNNRNLVSFFTFERYFWLYLLKILMGVTCFSPIGKRFITSVVHLLFWR